MRERRRERDKKRKREKPTSGKDSDNDGGGRAQSAHHLLPLFGGQRDRVRDVLQMQNNQSITNHLINKSIKNTRSHNSLLTDQYALTERSHKNNRAP